MNVATLRATLKSVARTVSGLAADGAVEWKGTKEAGYHRPLVRCDMSLRSFVALGNDEVRREYNAADDAQDVTICGQRQATWTLRFETQDGSDDATAEQYALRTIARLRRPSVVATLNDAKIAVSSTSAIQKLDGVRQQDRVLSVAVLDVILNLAEVDADDTDGVGEYIATVEIATDTLDNEAGDPVGNQLSITVGPA